MCDRVLNMPQILNITAFWIYQGSEYDYGSEYVRVLDISVLNMSG